eukprot:COSAG03_NODE_2810_length_2438_cov_2.114579_2_plen_88_part_00
MSGQGWRKLETDDPIDLESGGTVDGGANGEHLVEAAALDSVADGRPQPGDRSLSPLPAMPSPPGAVVADTLLQLAGGDSMQVRIHCT